MGDLIPRGPARMVPNPVIKERCITPLLDDAGLPHQTMDSQSMMTGILVESPFRLG